MSGPHQAAGGVVTAQALWPPRGAVWLALRSAVRSAPACPCRWKSSGASPPEQVPPRPTPRTGRACALGVGGGTRGQGGQGQPTPSPSCKPPPRLFPVPMDHLPKATGAESAGLNPHHIPDGKARILLLKSPRDFSVAGGVSEWGKDQLTTCGIRTHHPFSPGNTGHCERVSLTLGAFNTTINHRILPPGVCIWSNCFRAPRARSEIPARSEQARHPPPYDKVAVQRKLSPRAGSLAETRVACPFHLRYFRARICCLFLKDASDAWMGLTGADDSRSDHPRWARAEGVGLRVRLQLLLGHLLGLRISALTHHIVLQAAQYLQFGKS